MHIHIMNTAFQPCYDETVGGPRKKIPWIEYNGTVMSDSQHIIDYLNKKFNRDLNKHLSPKERATAWAIQKWLEESTYWYGVQSSSSSFVTDFAISSLLLPQWKQANFRILQLPCNTGRGFKLINLTKNCQRYKQT